MTRATFDSKANFSGAGVSTAVSNNDVLLAVAVRRAFPAAKDNKLDFNILGRY
jgi:hypothetical protein